MISTCERAAWSSNGAWLGIRIAGVVIAETRILGYHEFHFICPNGICQKSQIGFPGCDGTGSASDCLKVIIRILPIVETADKTVFPIPSGGQCFWRLLPQ